MFTFFNWDGFFSMVIGSFLVGTNFYAILSTGGGPTSLRGEDVFG